MVKTGDLKKRVELWASWKVKCGWQATALGPVSPAAPLSLRRKADAPASCSSCSQ